MERLTNIGSEFYQAIKEHYPMSSSAKSLDEMMRASLQDGGYAVPGGRGLFMEVMDTTTGLVWMSAAPVRADKGVRARYALRDRADQLPYPLAKGL